MSPDEPVRLPAGQARRLLWLVVAAIAAWGVYLAIGAYRGPTPGATSAVRGLIVLGCFGAFLGAWMLLLLARGRRLSRMEKKQ